MSRYDDLFDLLEENNDLAQEILEYQRRLEKKFEEVLALLKKRNETLQPRHSDYTISQKEVQDDHSCDFSRPVARNAFNSQR